jgi:predicted N-acyltransferase
MQWLNHICEVDSAQWNNTFPFLQKEFLSALQDNGSIGGESGWQPHYLQLKSPSLVLPTFIKRHSFGEYVFDWSWAEAYQKHGLNYYPKLIVAAPLTPVPSPKIIGCETRINGQEISDALQGHCREQGLSGVHYLFCNNEEKLLLQEHNWHLRKSVQFHWHNNQYTSFEHFLSTFKSRKRKAILKERLKIQQANIEITKLNGQIVSEADWHFFYYCYQSTYAKRGREGYINLDAFKMMAASMGDQMVLIKASHNDQPLACALYFKDHENLYGRYWGCAQEFPGLHFELCYYQGIEYCIEHGLKHFNPGTQGEHKISRGFEPSFCYSLHHLTHQGFHEAVGDFVRQESNQLDHYQRQCYEQLPFNQNHMPELRLD